MQGPRRRSGSGHPSSEAEAYASRADDLCDLQGVSPDCTCRIQGRNGRGSSLVVAERRGWVSRQQLAAGTHRSSEATGDRRGRPSASCLLRRPVRGIRTENPGNLASDFFQSCLPDARAHSASRFDRVEADDAVGPSANAGGKRAMRHLRYLDACLHLLRADRTLTVPRLITASRAVVTSWYHP